MIDRVKNALTRKIGPLPAWGWLGLVGVGIYIYRKRQAASGTVSSTGTGSVATTPPTPSDPISLDPGQSVYDPGTGVLSTAPGGGTGGDGTGTTGSPGGGPASIGGGNDPTTTPPQAITVRIIQSLPKIKRPLKAKPGSKSGKKPVKLKSPGHKNRPRSGAAVNNKHHTPSKNTTSKHGTTRTVKGGRSGTTLRQRPTTPATKPTLRQRPATGVQAGRREMVANPPRPSAPPPRKVTRTVSKPPAPKRRAR